MYQPKPNEKTFEVKPIGVAYECEFCHEGEQIADKENPDFKNGMFKHICNKCKKVMYLPRVYPYIEWEKNE